jgi:hypothetical protein
MTPRGCEIAPQRDARILCGFRLAQGDGFEAVLRFERFPALDERATALRMHAGEVLAPLRWRTVSAAAAGRTARAAAFFLFLPDEQLRVFGIRQAAGRVPGQARLQSFAFTPAICRARLWISPPVSITTWARLSPRARA